MIKKVYISYSEQMNSLAKLKIDFDVKKETKRNIMIDWQQKTTSLLDQGLSIQVERNGEILFQSKESMLKPLFTCLQSPDKILSGATVIDKVIGLAAAYFCILGGVEKIYTPLASQTAEKILCENNIEIKSLKTIPQIRNRDNTGPCPMEKLALSCESASDFYDKFLKAIQSK